MNLWAVMSSNSNHLSMSINWLDLFSLSLSLSSFSLYLLSLGTFLPCVVVFIPRIKALKGCVELFLIYVLITRGIFSCDVTVDEAKTNRIKKKVLSFLL